MAAGIFTDKGLKNLSKGPEKLISLQRISGDFTGCLQISDEGVRSLIEGIKELEFLQEMTFYFLLCAYVTDENVEIYRKTIKSSVLCKIVTSFES